MTSRNEPVPVSVAQWPESRSFTRVYAGNPDNQARLVMALLGFQQEILETASDGRVSTAITEVILAFSQRYPEFMQDGYEPDGDTGLGTYHLDERLATSIDELSSNQPTPD